MIYKVFYSGDRDFAGMNETYIAEFDDLDSAENFKAKVQEGRGTSVTDIRIDTAADRQLVTWKGLGQ